ncbi:MAG: sigma-70 family RNA polymerase sigma factor [Spirochaetia bacterium]
MKWLAERFEEHRSRLGAVAYRMLGSLGDAEDAVQEAWLRLGRSDAGEIENLGGWLTTVVARVCLNMLEARGRRREQPLNAHVPDPVVTLEDRLDPEQEMLLADSVGLALLVILDTLRPAERLAFVLHDMFDLSFDEIAPIVGRSPMAARQLASRARRRVRGARLPEPHAEADRAVANAFLAAARDGDFAALLRVLDPDVVLRADAGAVPSGVPRVVRGAAAVAKQAVAFGKRLGPLARAALVNGTAVIVAIGPDGRPLSVLGISASGGKIVEIDILADPARLSRMRFEAP